MNTQPRYDAETLLRAAIESMITGRHRPHCWHRPSTSADDFRRQLRRVAELELENMGYARAYAEPGMTQPKHGILSANWNVFPSGIDTTLEKAGYAVEWSDCIDVCEDCGGVVSTNPSSMCWTPFYQFVEGGRDYNDPYQSDSVMLCLNCLQEWAQGCRASELEIIAEQAEDAINAHASDWMYRDCSTVE